MEKVQMFNSLHLVHIIPLRLEGDKKETKIFFLCFFFFIMVMTLNNVCDIYFILPF